MITRTQERILLVVGGVAIGGITTYLATSKALAQKYLAMADEEIESTKEAFRDLTDRLQPAPEKPEVIVKEDRSVEEIQGELTESYLDKVQTLNYNKVSTKDQPVVESVITVVEVPAPPITEENAPPRRESIPFVISMAEFEEDGDLFTKESLAYYSVDNTVVDDRDEVIPHHGDVVGPDALSWFGWGSDDPKVVYVRNMKIGTDYEITLEEGSYSEEILGLPPVDR